MNRFTTKTIAWFLTFCFATSPWSTYAHADMISTGEVVSHLGQLEARAKVSAFLERSEVQREMVKFGVETQEAKDRVAAMSDQEIQQMASDIDTSPAGGDVIVIGLTTVLLIIIIYLLVR